MSKQHDEKYKIRVVGNIQHMGDSPTDWLQGSVYTPYGIVSAYSQDGGHPFTVLFFCMDGYRHSRRFDREMTARGMTSAAGRFAKEITEAGRKHLEVTK